MEMEKYSIKLRAATTCVEPKITKQLTCSFGDYVFEDYDYNFKLGIFWLSPIKEIYLLDIFEQDILLLIYEDNTVDFITEKLDRFNKFCSIKIIYHKEKNINNIELFANEEKFAYEIPLTKVYLEDIETRNKIEEYYRVEINKNKNKEK